MNERAANAYGQNSGGQPIGFGFSNSNNTAGASAFGTWLNGSAATGGAKYTTQTGLYMYDANYVAYNPLSTEPTPPASSTATSRVASLDTPAANVPTWALLFSQLPAVPITAAGTGYHVTIDGYGNNGTGTAGSTGGIDYRRRIAENTLGALASLGDFEQFLFGPSGPRTAPTRRTSTGSTSTIPAAAPPPPAPMISTRGATTPCPTRATPRAAIRAAR